MLRITLAQMRRSLGRLASAGIAIAIGTAFVAATLLAGGVMTRSSYDAVTAQLAHADLVGGGGASEDQLAAIRATAGVDAADPSVTVGAELQNGSTRIWTSAVVTASDPRLEPQVVTAGALPTTTGQVALPVAIAERLDVAVGDDLIVQRQVFVPAPEAATAPPASGTAAGSGSEPAVVEGEWTTVDESITVVGLLDDPGGAYLQWGGAAIVTAAEALVWAHADSLTDLGPSAVLIAVSPGADVDAVRAALVEAVPDLELMSKDEAAQAQIAQISDGSDVFLGLVLAFAAVALVVAALVIANTFQVLVAQRTRTLALLRCVGADKRQLRLSVLLEAAILGVAASVVGLVTGITLAQVALLVLNRMSLDVPLPTTVSVTAWVVLAPLLVGTAVTVMAALVPARAASRVTPITALRPAEAPALTSRGSRVRLVLSLVLTLGGLGGLLAGTPLVEVDPMLGLAVAVLGGAVSFVGVLVGSVFWIPRVVALVGRMLGPTGTSARLAAANTLRNPRRTAATSTALLIGVTLVSMMSTGAASARATLGNELDGRYPVDVIVGAVAADDGSSGAIPDRVEQEVSGVAGVGELVAVRAAAAVLGPVVPATGDTSSPSGTAPGDAWVTLRAIDRDDARAVMRSAGETDGLTDDSVVISSQLADLLGVEEGDPLPVEGRTTLGATSAASAGDETGTLRTVVVDTSFELVLVTPATLARLAPDAPVNELWVRLADVNAAGDVVPRIQDAVAETAVEITGAGLERASMQRLIDTMLAVVVGLLAVAVVIALVGVANTLSLSVLERRRESATLRAIGLSRGQLRLMLAIEGMLIAGVGGAIGAGLGLLFGWAGASTLLSTVGDVTFAVPWRDLGLVVVVALAAGLLASVLPGRSAARTSPVAALAVD